MNQINQDKKKESVTPTGDYIPRPYRKWLHLFGIHSWMPLYADIEAIQSDPASIRPGFTLMSQNQLSTMIATAGYEYSKDKRHLLHTRLIWKGWYPVVESNLSYNMANRPINPSSDPVSWVPSQINPGLKFTTSIYLPLTFNSGKFTQSIYPFFSSEYNNKYIYHKELDTYDYGQTIMTGRLYLSNSSRPAFRDIYPRLAQVFDLSYTSAPFDKWIYGTDLALQTSFYFPGLLKNNSLRIRFETERQSYPKTPSYNNRIHFPRSYTNIVSGKLDFLSSDYYASLFYPDFNIFSLFYLTRVRTGIFYDYAKGTDNYFLDKQTRNQGTEIFQSFGIELLSDFYLFRIPYMITGGVQAAWKEIGRPPTFELLFNIDIYGMNIGRRRL